MGTNTKQYGPPSENRPWPKAEPEFSPGCNLLPLGCVIEFGKIAGIVLADPIRSAECGLEGFKRVALFYDGRPDDLCYSGGIAPCVPPIPTGQYVVDELSPFYCQQLFVNQSGQCLVFNLETKCFEEILVSKTQLGSAPAAGKGVRKFVATIRERICNDTAAVIDLTRDQLVAVIATAAETFPDPAGTAVDIATAGHVLTDMNVTGYPCPFGVKKDDGTTFMTSTAEACLVDESGDRLNLAQNGSSPAGDMAHSPVPHMIVDNSVSIPVGSAVEVCASVCLYLDADDNVLYTEIPVNALAS